MSKITNSIRKHFQLNILKENTETVPTTLKQNTKNNSIY